MDYTPYINYTDDELLRIVASKEDVTDLELELAQRLETAQLEVNRLSSMNNAHYERVRDRVDA